MLKIFKKIFKHLSKYLRNILKYMNLHEGQLQDCCTFLQKLNFGIKDKILEFEFNRHAKSADMHFIASQIEKR